MDTVKDKIRELLEPVLAAEGIELVEIECARMGSRWLVRIFMDRENGVNLQDCSEMSRIIGDILDAHDLPRGPYNLEVSSPGLDRPLVRDKDFIKYRNHRIKVRVGEKIEGSRNFKGVLVDLH